MNSKAKRNYGSLIRWIIFIVLIGCAGLIALNLSINGFVPRESAVTVLNVLLGVDIALVAFYGLILVFSLNYVNGVKERAAREKHEITIQRDRFRFDYTARLEGITSDTPSALQMIYSETDEAYKRRIEELDKEFESDVSDMSRISIAAIITLGFIFGDILLNVYFLGAMTDKGLEVENLFIDLAVLVSTLFLISESLLFFQPKTERDIVIKELKRLWNESKQRRESGKNTAEQPQNPQEEHKIAE